MFGRLISLFLFIIIFPLYGIVGCLIFIIDGGPIIFKQKRIGKKNRSFELYKFRTMKLNTPNKPTHLLKNSEKLYIPFGKIIRNFSLDELPQLLNIIKGDMVFFGPRPALYNQDDLISMRTDCNVHLIKPGITGWAQVNGWSYINPSLGTVTKVKSVLRAVTPQTQLR